MMTDRSRVVALHPGLEARLATPIAPRDEISNAPDERDDDPPPRPGGKSARPWPGFASDPGLSLAA